jgi:hypothetical protein
MRRYCTVFILVFPIGPRKLVKAALGYRNLSQETENV